MKDLFHRRSGSRNIGTDNVETDVSGPMCSPMTSAPRASAPTHVELLFELKNERLTPAGALQTSSSIFVRYEAKAWSKAGTRYSGTRYCWPSGPLLMVKPSGICEIMVDDWPC